MRNYLFAVIILLTFSSCKEEKAFSKPNKTDKEKNIPKNNPNTVAQKIHGLYNPGAMTIKGNRVGNNAEKEIYQIILTDSELLDADQKNIEKHAEKIATIYYEHLSKTLKPFNFEKIIVIINHRDKKIDKFEYSEKKFHLESY